MDEIYIGMRVSEIDFLQRSFVGVSKRLISTGLCFRRQCLMEPV
jgi:hypothetical protein